MMKLRVLGLLRRQHPRPRDDVVPASTTRVALDAGWVSGALSLKEQVKVKDILISHSHLDHTCTLPFLIDNNFSAPGFSLRIYAIPEVDRVDEEPPVQQPHLAGLHEPAQRPDAGAEAGRDRARSSRSTINGLTIRAVHVSHIVPTTGFIVEDKKGAIAFSSDTGPTHRFWEVVNATKNLQGGDHRDVVPERAAGPGQRLRPPHAGRPSTQELKKLEEGRARLPLRRQAQAPEDDQAAGARR